MVSYGQTQTQMQSQMQTAYNSNLASSYNSGSTGSSSGSSGASSISTDAFQGIEVDTESLRSFATSMKQQADTLLQIVAQYQKIAAGDFPAKLQKNTLNKDFPPILSDLMSEYQTSSVGNLEKMGALAEMIKTDMDVLIEYANNTEQLTEESTNKLKKVNM